MMASLLRRRLLSATRTLANSSHIPVTRRFISRPILSTRITQCDQLRTFTSSPPYLQQAQAVQSPDTSFPVLTRFEDLSDQIEQNVLDALTKDMKLETMTEVQQRTLTEALQGTDIVGQAKTGTGKTVAFLLPMIQRALQVNPQFSATSNKTVRANDICGIVISPTRELAEQIAAEAKRVTKRTGLRVQLAVGGTQKSMMLNKTRYEGCHLLIGTPGRIKDLLSDPHSGIAAPNLNCLVLDEADRLLDVGFGPDIEAIKSLLPDPQSQARQNMLFSATISQEVVNLVRHTLQPGFKFVQCVDPEASLTHENVSQKLVLLPGFENRMPALFEMIEREQEKSKEPGARPFKAMIFFNATTETALAASILKSRFGVGSTPFGSFGRNAGRGSDFGVYEIHGQLSQNQRTSVSENFRNLKTGILCTSDVTARGLDFPNVTHVIQVGVPIQSPRETYIHRLGRTARAGKEGEGWLFVTDIEAPLAKRHLLGLPLQRDDSLKTIQVDLIKGQEVPEDVKPIFDRVQKIASRSPPQLLDGVYVNSLRNTRNADKREVVERANFYAKVEWGMEEPPTISPKMAQGLALKVYDGVRIGQTQQYGQDPFGRRDGGSSGGYGFNRGQGQGQGRRGGFGGFGGQSQQRRDPFSRDSQQRRDPFGR